MGPLQKSLHAKITAALSPLHLEIENESHSHSVPRNSETHFRAVIVSEIFTSLSRVARQRAVLAAITDEMQGGVHAFTMRCLAPHEWKDQAATVEKEFVSPPCHGGSKADRKS